ncbi:peptide/nickel transport system ATP-binding protein/oligopeptide transport system ATP-binding protein [Kribbella sp. VKM Ac-2527]|uniref:Peptide/nickel transport system ATP-binding protein/oligopeptide transport system ATP-binding protein n=1 Tax=Kribbella caucasensis TaxID=2512215 RepID=A0A4R6KAS2_9ACTN|nr:ABC transporter ATP-binding protein [Kribbella sp. VKM Ac-2527]TDO45771.1 peptide/nickel transport system ATP-binding protein/oligopeptide transport system ATP-binding protein [Kribbella sp. VKM Ac-2527]
MIEVSNLVKTYPVNHRKELTAVGGVSFSIREGETLALVGESGSGKSTVGRCLLRLIEPTSGDVRYRGKSITGLSRRQLRPLRQELQIVFQDPYSAIDPRMTIEAFLAEPMQVHGWARPDIAVRVTELLVTVDLGPELAGRYPHELSGGQRQRVVIARALALRPRLLVLDEPVAALDVSIQAGIMRLLSRLQRDQGLSYLFIAHDLAVVRQLSHRVAVMHRGLIVETGAAKDVYTFPRHPYTRALLSAIPMPDPRLERQRKRIVLSGDPPDPADRIEGCAFRSRCWKSEEDCSKEEPTLTAYDTPTLVACHHPETEPAGIGAESRS